MISVKSAIKLLTVGAAAITIASGCATAKKGEMAEAAAAPAAAAPAAADMMASDKHTVRPGEHLWGIAGMDSIYNDPFYWPILFSRNRSQIQDADLIYAGQVLTVARQFNPREVANAISHAKNRGPWALGITEDSDTAFLAANVVSNEPKSDTEYVASNQQ